MDAAEVVIGHRDAQGVEQRHTGRVHKLGVHLGETTKDQMFSLESARCLGTCGLAPVMMVGEQVYGPVTPAEASRILDKYLKEEKAKTAPREEPAAAHVS